MKKNSDIIVLSENRKARHDFLIVETIEAGIALEGSEVKSIKAKQVNLAGSYVVVLKGELQLVNCNIPRYSSSSSFVGNLTRARKLLCHAKEIRDLKQKTEAKGMTAIPLKLYSKNGQIKLEIGIARGKNSFDKRESLKRKDLNRDNEMYNIRIA